ncbi:hypothetical protein NC651_025974 [Populus alba x Populus x berolinensis]|nr:hypothetical protein NC651_025974 [Populus alba x Populus x berolinensis]
MNVDENLKRPRMRILWCIFYHLSRNEIAKPTFERFPRQPGQLPLLCKLHFSSSKGLGFEQCGMGYVALIYSRFEMVHDALFVLVNMKEQNLRPSIQTYNSLLYHLRHTDNLWDVYNDIKDSGHSSEC